MKYWKTGTFLAYDSVLEMVETFETLNNLVPQTETGLQINVCSGLPKALESNDKSELNTPLSDIQTLKQFHFSPETQGHEKRNKTLDQVISTLKDLVGNPTNENYDHSYQSDNEQFDHKPNHRDSHYEPRKYVDDQYQHFANNDRSHDHQRHSKTYIDNNKHFRSNSRNANSRNISPPCYTCGEQTTKEMSLN